MTPHHSKYVCSPYSRIFFEMECVAEGSGHTRKSFVAICTAWKLMAGSTMYTCIVFCLNTFAPE